MGTTGEGILLSPAERRRVTDLFVNACAGRLDVAVHCGAQTTADTVALAEHAAAAGADAVAVIGPPYFQLDDDALLAHFQAAALACEPTPFYVYEFARVSGYAVPVRVVERLREVVPNLVGMKVSDAPFEQVEPYLVEGLDIFVGAESLIGAGMERGAKGSVSALATAFPELVVAAVRDCRARAQRGARRAPRRPRGIPAACGAEANPRLARRAPKRGRARPAPRPRGGRAAGSRRLGFSLDRPGEQRKPRRARLARLLAAPRPPWGHPGPPPTFSLTARNAHVRDGTSRECVGVQEVCPRRPSAARAGCRRPAVGPHMRKTPNVVSGIGALSAAEIPSAITLRVSTGSMIPSSQSRAVE